MTDRYNAILVTFEEPVREDDLEVYLDAIRLMRRVIKVEPFAPNSIDHDVAGAQARYQLRREIIDKLAP